MNFNNYILRYMHTLTLGFWDIIEEDKTIMRDRKRNHYPCSLFFFTMNWSCFPTLIHLNISVFLQMLTIFVSQGGSTTMKFTELNFRMKFTKMTSNLGAVPFVIVISSFLGL